MEITRHNGSGEGGTKGHKERKVLPSHQVTRRLHGIGGRPNANWGWLWVSARTLVGDRGGFKEICDLNFRGSVALDGQNIFAVIVHCCCIGIKPYSIISIKNMTKR